MTETLTDLFCGAGGSGQGAHGVAGVELRMAANHWQRAIDTHQANFPDVAHDCADVSQVDPRRYPRTTLLWASPECTKHAAARGKKHALAQLGLFGNESERDPGAERSRATMWDVPRFAEYHDYRAIVVENVVEVARWAMFPAWLHAMQCLGYRHRIVWLNSMHVPVQVAPRAPQSRDRVYVVFWQAGQHAPDLDLRPTAWCGSCGTEVAAVQTWKRPDRAQWGRYRTQYVYRCPNSVCRHAVVEPHVLPAATVIDWSRPGTRIGERAVPLSAGTLARIRGGLARYARPDTGTAFIAELRGGGSMARSVDAPLATVTASGRHHMLIRHNTARGDAGQMCTPLTEPARTFTTTGHQSLVGWPPPHPSAGPAVNAGSAVLQMVEACTFRMLEPGEIAAAMAFTPAYQVLGSKRDQVRQLGNAVTPPAAEWLLRAVVASLNGGAS